MEGKQHQAEGKVIGREINGGRERQRINQTEINHDRKRIQDEIYMVLESQENRENSENK